MNGYGRTLTLIVSIIAILTAVITMGSFKEKVERTEVISCDNRNKIGDLSSRLTAQESAYQSDIKWIKSGLIEIKADLKTLRD